MTRFRTTATTRALGRLAAVVVGSLIAVAPATAQEADVDRPPTPSAQQQAPAPEQTGIAWTTGWTWGARGALSFLSEDSLETGFGFSGFAVLPLSTDFELEGEIGYQTMSTVTGGLPKGRLSLFPLRATVRVQLWRFGGARPYAAAGLGLYFSRFSIDQSVLDDLATVGFGASQAVDTGLGFHGGGGLEWQSGRVYYGVDVKYLFGSTDAVSTLVDQVTGQIIRETSQLSFDGFWISAGARFSF